VHSLAFAKRCTAVLVLSTLTKLMPSCGPRRNFSKLRILGYGFWGSPTIIVKFSPKIANIYNLPRSCMGTLGKTGDGEEQFLECKPPKFAEAGVYVVSVSLDGTTYLSTELELNIYKDIEITHQEPAFVDARAICNSVVSRNN
jgi:hypothetical protein